MSDGRANSRALANHELYLAKIVLAAWRRDLELQAIPARLLAQAFAAAVRGHLVSAYGWFLLTISGVQTLPGGPPRCCADLAAAPDGGAIPAEINEFRQLEASGWLAELLRVQPDDLPGPRRSHNLALDAGSLPQHAQMQAWADQLESLFERMSDSLDEC